MFKWRYCYLFQTDFWVSMLSISSQLFWNARFFWEKNVWNQLLGSFFSLDLPPHPGWQMITVTAGIITFLVGNSFFSLRYWVRGRPKVIHKNPRTPQINTKKISTIREDFFVPFTSLHFHLPSLQAHQLQLQSENKSLSQKVKQLEAEHFLVRPPLHIGFVGLRVDRKSWGSIWNRLVYNQS